MCWCELSTTLCSNVLCSTGWFIAAQKFINKRDPIGSILYLYVAPLLALIIISLAANTLLCWRRHQETRHLRLVEMVATSSGRSIDEVESGGLVSGDALASSNASTSAENA